MAHARLGPSNHRWPHCPGSVRVEEQYQDIAGDAAIDGTGSHMLLELCLINGVRADAYDRHIIGLNHHDMPGGWLVDLDRIERVQMCLDYVTRRVGELKQQFDGCSVSVAAEAKADPGGAFGRHDWWGTVDITLTVVNDGKCVFLEVIDYKDGRGWVSTKDKETQKHNTQLLSYLVGQLRLHCATGPELVRPFRTDGVGCRLTIVQPKTQPPIRYENLTAEQAFREAEQLAMAADRTDDPDAPLIPGKHCTWCKHGRAKNCNAKSEQSMGVITTMTNDVIATDGTSLFELVGSALTDVSSLDSEKLAELADAEAGIQAVFDKVKTEIERRVKETPGAVPGYEMGYGRGENVWNEDAEKIEKMLKARRLTKADIYPTKLISPAQVLKSSKLTKEQKERIEKEYITKKEGKPCLKKVARNSKPSVEELFSGLIQKDVAQSSTDAVQSKSMFDDVSFF